MSIASGVASSPGLQFVFARSLYLRWLGAILLIANAIALRQNRPLLGANGLLPVDKFLASRRSYGDTFWDRPSLMWFAARDGVSATAVDRALDGHAIAGMVLACPLLLTGTASALQVLCSWALYLSLCNVGQRWYGFGWESMMLETTFLTTFICPLRPWSAAGAAFVPPVTCLWAFRWLLCRIMLGAGLIKLRSSDRCWRDLSAMDHHYLTQPIPNPLSRSLHRAPKAWHRIETFVGLWIVEIATPPLLLLPGGGATGLGAVGATLRHASALLQLAFQLILILSGNLSFLNWLTMAPAIMCLDDATLTRLLPWASEAAAHRASLATSQAASFNPAAGMLVQAALAAVLLRASVPVVANLISPKQRMNACFGPWRLLNTYGAFGTVSKRRYEVEIQGTDELYPTADAEWRAYEFVAKPGDPRRSPRWLSPWHLRLDWLMWFLPFGSWRQAEWLQPLVRKLLANDAGVTKLLRHNPFAGSDPPKWVRAVLWEYEFADLSEAKEGLYWKRALVRDDWMPPSSVERPAGVRSG